MAPAPVEAPSMFGATTVRYRNISFMASVLPAPDSPVMTIAEDWPHLKKIVSKTAHRIKKL
jgi:hypothetical protein